MTTGKALNGKPYAGNPHVRFDEGEVAPCTSEASLRRVHCRRQPEVMTRPQVASRSEVARGLRASVCATTPRRGSLLYTTGKALNGKPDAGNPHVAPSQCYGGTGRFDEGEVASCTAEASLRRVHCRRQPEGRASVCAAMPRRGSLLYKKKEFVRGMLVALSSRVA